MKDLPAVLAPQLNLPFGTEIGPTSLSLSPNLDDEELVQVGRTLKSLHMASAWWIADFILEVINRRKGNRRTDPRLKTIYDRVAELWPQYSRSTLHNLASVARRVPRELRSSELSFDHHAHIASLAEEENAAGLQRHFIETAVRVELTAEELRLAIADTKKGNVLTLAPKSERRMRAAKEAKEAEEQDDRASSNEPAGAPDQTDGLPIPRAARDEPAGVLRGTHAQLCADTHRDMGKVLGWYNQEKKRSSGEAWTAERKAALIADLTPLMDAIGSLVDIYHGLTNAAESGEWSQ